MSGNTPNSSINETERKGRLCLIRSWCLRIMDMRGESTMGMLRVKVARNH